MASSSTSFAKLLKSSKVISQYDPAIPSLVYTSHGGSFKRSDFGLKRALPRMKSPAIKVASLDSPTMKLTDFEYGSRELQFVKRWRESGAGISGHDPSGDYSMGSAEEAYKESMQKVAEQPGACTWDRENFTSIEDLKAYAKTGKPKGRKVAGQKQDQTRQAQVQEALTSDRQQFAQPGQATSTSEVSFSPNYLEMDDAEFELFLEEVKHLRPQYRRYAETQFNATQSTAHQLVFDVHNATTNPEQLKSRTGRRIDEFLNQHLGVSSENKSSLDHLRPRPHHSLGLSYQPPNLYQSDVANRAVPLRVLQEPRTSGFSGLSATRNYPVSVLGTVSLTKTQDLLGAPNTAHYVPDAEGNLNTGYGKMEGRVEVATINPDYVRARSGQYDLYEVASESVNSFSAGRAPSSGVTPASRSILDEAPISIRMYAPRKTESASSGQSQLTFRQKEGQEADNRIGGRNWVQYDPEAAMAASRSVPVKDMSTKELFGQTAGNSRWGRNKISPPNPDELARPNGYPGAREAAAQKPKDGSLSSLLGEDHHGGQNFRCKMADFELLIATLQALREDEKPRARSGAATFARQPRPSAAASNARPTARPTSSISRLLAGSGNKGKQ